MRSTVLSPPVFFCRGERQVDEMANTIFRVKGIQNGSIKQNLRICLLQLSFANNVVGNVTELRGTRYDSNNTSHEVRIKAGMCFNRCVVKSCRLNSRSCGVV